MTPERWQSVKTVLATALELDAAERDAYVRIACNGDVALAGEVRRLLAASALAGADFLSTPPVLSAEDDLDPIDPWIGRTLGAYRICERLGAGGMGAVYRASRVDDEYDADVAIKVVRDEPGALFVARFKAERQILAGLQHPNIGRLLDGGTTPEGIPYFVMELIRGEPITGFAEGRALSIEARLRLFLTVCSAVDYAHHRLVVHRDIKPGNILVTADGVPKLLDFGIARVLDGAGNALSVTASGPWPMTPGYASPEQLRGEEITTVTDVYSLGLVLYELLTGTRAIPVHTTLPHEAARLLLETTPRPPSAVAPERWRRRLAGDLDTLVLTSIRKDPRERYASVERLADDIRRHLEGRPIQARKDTLRYRCAKFLRRNGFAVTVTTAVLLVVATAIGIALRSAAIVRAERARAEQRIDDLRQLARSNLFELHDAIQALPGSAPARNLLIGRTLQYLDHLNADGSGRTRELQEELAVGYERIAQLQGNFSGPGIGDSRAALASYAKAVAIRESLADSAPGDVAELTALGDLLTNQSMTLQLVGRIADAADAARKALTATTHAAQLRPGDPRVVTAVAMAHARLASVIGGTGSSGSTREIAAAIDHDRRALAILSALPPAAAAAAHVREVVQHVQMHLGFHLAKVRAFGEAARVFDALVAADRRHPVLTTADRILVYNYRGLAFARAGDDRRALADFESQLALARTAAASDAGDLQARIAVAIARADVGVETARLGQPANGLAEIRQALRTGEELLRANPAELFYADLLAVGYAYEAETLSSLGDQHGAARQYGGALAMAARVARADPQDFEWPLSIGKLHAALAAVYGREADYADAIREAGAARAALASLRAARPSDVEGAYVARLNDANAAVLQACAAGSACDAARLRLPSAVN